MTRARPAGPRETCSWSRSVELRLSRAQLWELMWRPEGQRRWLGPRACLDLTSRGRWALVDEAGHWRFARHLAMAAPASLTMGVEPPAAWGRDAAETRVTIRLAAAADTGCRVTIEEDGLPAERVDEAGRYWSRRLVRLESMIAGVRRRRTEVRQAVVVIHGIGEQQPGSILSGLVGSGALSSSDEQGRWVKPDRVSGSFELRSVTLAATDTRPITDAFEFYWAHVIRDTTLRQIAAWLRRLLVRWPVPAPLRPIWLAAWAGVSLGLAAAVAASLGADVSRWIGAGTVATALAGLAWTVVGRGLALDVLGDAARYLMPHPANVAHRQAIREAGVDLLETLHASGRYDRIVILGHSLGSVIAYDIVTHAWTRVHAHHERPSRPAFGDVVAVERSIDVEDVEAARGVQHAAWRRQRANTQPWLVSDLVTAGSPLTYADFLMAASPEAFARSQADRTLPTCPPTTEVERNSGHRRATFELPYRDAVDGGSRTFTVFHHGAPFAVTRWTNLYFEVGRLGTSGDLIGGPVAPRFGGWVRDVALPPPAPGFAHTWYWRASDRTSAHLDALRAALDLDARAGLLSLLEELPAFALLDGATPGDARRDGAA